MKIAPTSVRLREHQWLYKGANMKQHINIFHTNIFHKRNERRKKGISARTQRRLKSLKLRQAKEDMKALNE